MVSAQCVSVQQCLTQPVHHYYVMLSFLIIEAMFLSLRLFFFIPDFIKVGDDPGAGKGKSGDSTKM